MIKKLLLSTLIYVLSLAIITLISPSIGFQIATFTGTVIAQPITFALKLGLALRGLI